MTATTLKEKLGTNNCHIHHAGPSMSILENGKLKVNTCCILFKQQLNMLIDEQDQKLVE